MTSALDDAIERGSRLEGQDPRDGTFAGVRAAVRDLEREAAIEADVTRVISQATDGLRKRVADAPALVRSARALLDRLGPRAGDQIRRNLPTLNSDLNEVTLPTLAGLPMEPLLATPTVPQVQAAALALARVAGAERASRAVLTPAAVRLEEMRKQNAVAMTRAAPARSLLRFGGPRQAVLTDRLGSATRAVPDEAALVGAWPSTPGTDRVTRADLEAAHRALAGQARALGSATRRINLAANDVFGTAPDRWRQLRMRAQSLRPDVSRLFPNDDERPEELRNAFAQHAAALARAEADVPGALNSLGQINPRIADFAPGIGAMADLADATERLSMALRATTRGRADALLGPHSFTLDELTTVMPLAEGLVPAGQRAEMDEENFFSPARMDQENFSWLARQIGLHNQDGPIGTVRRVADRPAMAQLFALVLLAFQVYDGPTRPTLANVADLRRLADLIRDGRYQRQRDVTVDNLRAKFRELHQILDPAAPVSTEDLRELIGQVGLAKSVLARQGGLAEGDRAMSVTPTWKGCSRLAAGAAGAQLPGRPAQTWTRSSAGI